MPVGDAPQYRCPWASAEQDETIRNGSLYPQLRARRKGVTRAQVITDQQARLYGAMVEAVARHGYECAPVAEIARLAGVSTRTLYERFDSKEGCLQATCDVIANQALEKISLACGAGAAEEHDADAHPLGLAVSAFASVIAMHPKEAAFVLVEAPTAGAETHRKVAHAHAQCAEALLARLALEGEDPLPPVVVLGVVHGISHVGKLCLLEAEPQRAPELLAQLMGWVLRCVSPAAMALDPARTDSQAVGRIAALLPGATARCDRVRELLPRIAAEIVARDGRGAVSVARICEAAEIGLDEFFSLYASAEACLLAAGELLSAEALANALRAVEQPPRDVDGWCDALCSSVTAVLHGISRDPVLQSLGFAEPLAVNVTRRRAAILRRFAEVLVRRAPRSAHLESPVSDAVVGAVWGVAQEYVLRGEANLLPSLAGQLSFLVLCAIVDPERAAETALRAAAL